MKTQIRRGVFETNSSSIHSLQLAKQTLDEAKKDISQKISQNVKMLFLMNLIIYTTMF